MVEDVIPQEDVARSKDVKPQEEVKRWDNLVPQVELIHQLAEKGRHR